ncbi:MULTISPECIES: PilW family protein [Gammaproteobacteria]|uniref:PilW family protein n=1 Tax=Gammaproteobacteria TaxID=1236 RepID=UPI003A8EEE4A
MSKREKTPTIFKQHGLSLVELMIALVLGLLLSTGILTIFISSKQDYQVQDAVSQVQENGRFSLDFVSHDLRMAGFSGCRNDMPTANSIENAPPSLLNFSDGIEGYDGDNGTLPTSRFPKALAGTDAVVIYIADVGEQMVVTSHNPNSAVIHFSEDHDHEPGKVMMIVDSNCSSRGIFVMTGPTNNNDNADHVVHNTGNTFTFGSSSGVGNCTKSLKGNFTCDDTSGALAIAYTPGSSVFSVKSIGYYIRDPAQDSSLNAPTLYRVEFASELDPNASGNVYQPLVEGISDLDILYGVYEEPAKTLEYKQAGAVDTAAEWNQVTTVRLDIEAESLTEIDGSPLTRNYVRTVKLRNR